jgi:hypothetical protein
VTEAELKIGVEQAAKSDVSVMRVVMINGDSVDVRLDGAGLTHPVKEGMVTFYDGGRRVTPGLVLEQIARIQAIAEPTQT